MPIATKAEEHECCGRVPTKQKVRSIQQKARLPNDWTQGTEMTPDGCRGSFHVSGRILGRPRAVPSGAAGQIKTGRKNPTQHSYHIIIPFSSQWENASRSAKSVPCTKTDVCIWETFRLEKFGNSCYLIVTKRRCLNSKSSGGLPKAKVIKGNQSDFKSK